MAERDAKTTKTGRKPRGRPPAPPVEGPLPGDQVNLTDAESRIMPVAGGGFEQCYNAQAAVAADSLLVVAVDVSQAPNDKQQLAPMLDRIAGLPDDFGPPTPFWPMPVISARPMSRPAPRRVLIPSSPRAGTPITPAWMTLRPRAAGA